ncbi:MAG: hypothetical protein NZO58_05500 [Gemmataceae bacterium]|nr:hypothetical protein [Gemmataceae bacterium]
MNWQLTVALAFVALASVYLARRAYRSWSAATRGDGCGGCGCAAAPAPRDQSQRRISLSRYMVRRQQ